MFSGRQSIFIPFDREVVYKTAETYPYFVRFFLKDSRILEQSDEHIKVEVNTKLLGFFPSRWQGAGRKKRYQGIRFTQTKGLFKGLTALWQFSEVSQGTRVSIRTVFSKPQISRLGEWLLGKFVVEDTTRKILSELRNCLESDRRRVSAEKVQIS